MARGLWSSALVVLALGVAGVVPHADAGARPRCQPEGTALRVVDQRLYRYYTFLVDDAVVANAASAPVEHVHVSVEFYNFFDELLRAERTILTPLVLPAGALASFRVSTPFPENLRKVAYRFTGRSEAGTFQTLVVCDADVRP